MRFYFTNETFDSDQIVSGKINQKKLSAYEQSVLKYAKEWLSDQEKFKFRTSGSTGAPKEILLSREQLKYSAGSTISYLFGKKSLDKTMLCLNPEFVGGRQVIYRALEHDINLLVNEPNSNALEFLEQRIDLMSMVPLQVSTTLRINPEKFDLVDCVLIGGGQVPSDLDTRLQKIESTRFYQTFGMTETASHIALRKIGSKYYEPIGDVELDTDDRSCLKARGTVTNNQWLQTNDIVELGLKVFEWIGRADFVVNSGGIKLHPEQLEQKIREAFPNISFALTGKADPELGEKLVLITTTPLLSRLKSLKRLTGYEIPKEEIVVQEMPQLASGKLDRVKLKMLVN